MVTNYFLNTDPDQWNIKDAYQEMEREVPSLSSRKLLELLKENLQSLITTDANDSEKATAALELLKSWRVSCIFGTIFFHRD